MAAQALVRSVGVPLWSQLLIDLRRRVDDGDFDLAFPGELALAEQYAVSRPTVREALRRLRADGVVSAARGRQPRLTPTLRQPLGAVYSLFSSVEAQGMVQRSDVRRLEVLADGTVSARLGLEESTPLLLLERVRWAGDEPLALDRVWLPASLAAPLLDADFTHTGLYAELAGRCGLRLTGGQETVTAVVASPAERRALGIEPHIALLAIDRLGCAEGRPVEWRQTLVRGDRFALTATSGPGSPAALSGTHRRRSR